MRQLPTDGEAWQTNSLEGEDDDEDEDEDEDEMSTTRTRCGGLPARRSPMQRYRTPGLGSGGLESEVFDGFLGLVIQLFVR